MRTQPPRPSEAYRRCLADPCGTEGVGDLRGSTPESGNEPPVSTPLVTCVPLWNRVLGSILALDTAERCLMHQFIGLFAIFVTLAGVLHTWGAPRWATAGLC